MKKGDFVRIDYTGKLTDGTVFDTTVAAVGKPAGIEGDFTPRVICIGEHMLLSSIDDALDGKPVGTFTLELSADQAFGKKDTKLLQMVPTTQLQKQGIRPQPGLRLEIDGQYGVVKTTGGGRTVVDFNHPLAGQDVVYEVTVIEEVKDVTEQVTAIVSPLGIKEGITIKDNHVTLMLPQVPPKPIMDAIQEKITTLTRITTVSFEAGKK